MSDNTVFAQMASDLGYAKLDATAHAMGINSPLDGNPAEVIGSTVFDVMNEIIGCGLDFVLT